MGIKQITILRKIVAFLVVLSVFFLGREFLNKTPAQVESVSQVSAVVEKTIEKILKKEKIVGDWRTVRRVIDGDTIEVESSLGTKQKVRLLGINTPETVDPRRPVQCFGKEASAYTKEVLLGKSVRLETDASQDKIDKYGRLLAYIFLDNGTLFNKKIIEDGYAYEYTYRLPYKYQKEFKEAEALARSEGMGLWAPGVCGY
ncbi:MAG: thermonuclease family protein [Patescibacteria group bacterium]